MKTLYSVVLVLFTNYLIISQSPEPGCENTLSKGTMTLSNQGGKYLTASGDLKVLVVFAKFKDDTSSHQFWPADSYPDEMNNFIDPDMQKGSTHFMNLTNYYNQMSFGNFRVTGRAIGVETPYPMSHYIYGNVQYPERWVANKAILEVVDDSINYNEFDNWKYIYDYQHNNVPDGKIDMIVVIWRGLVFSEAWNGEMSLGYGQEFFVENNQKRILMCHGGDPSAGSCGSGVTVQYWGERSSERNFKVVIHEIAHWLIQVEHPYGSFKHTFWGMLTLGTEGICANSFEREKLGWLNVTPIENSVSNSVLSDYVTTQSAYKYHPQNGMTGEMYYFENHQQLSIYDNGISNPNDKGIFILHLKNNSYSGDCLRILTSDGFWNWQTPFQADCWGNYLPAFKKVSVNRNRYGNRDKITVDNITPEFLYSFVNENYQIECNDWLHGYGFNNAFDTTFNDVFSTFSNPPARTGDDQFADFFMEVTGQTGSVLTATFATQDAAAGKPSKPPLGLNPDKTNYQYQNHTIFLAWGSDIWDSQPIEPDIDWSELQISIDSLSYSTIYTGNNRFYSGNTYNYDSTGNSSVSFRVRVRDNQNKWSIWSDPIDIRVNDQSKVGPGEDQVSSFYISQNYPNPFNSSTTIRFKLPEANYVTLRIFNSLGEEIAILIDNEYQESGIHSEFYTINSALPSGVYFYRLQSGNYSGTKKMIFLK